MMSDLLVLWKNKILASAYMDSIISISNRLLGENINLLGVALQGLRVLGKFVLFSLLTRFLPLEVVGIYGLFTTTVLFVVYLTGLDFYTFSTREILAASVEDRPRLIRDQAILHSLLYVAIFPLLVGVFIFGFLPWRLLGYFYWIVVVSHLTQEIHRLLISLSHTEVAFIVSFLTHGIWTPLIVIVSLIHPAVLSLESVLFAWGVAGTLGVGTGLLFLNRFDLMLPAWERVNWNWLLKGVRVCYKFFIASLGYRLISSSSRYFLKYFRGEKAVGIYSTYDSIALILQDFVFTAITAVIFPLIVDSYQNGNYAKYKKHVKQLTKSVSKAILLLLPCFVVGIYILLAFIGKQELYNNLAVYFVLLASQFVMNLSMVPHYMLFAQKKDNAILYTVLMGVVVSIISNTLLIPNVGTMGAAWSTLAAFITIGMGKCYYAVWRES
jgi:O-antigen/teichoic acid export membrane protein